MESDKSNFTTESPQIKKENWQTPIIQTISIEETRLDVVNNSDGGAQDTS